MARKEHGTAIEWTQRPGTRGETLNPIRAKNRETGKRGWFCVHANADCINCYAERINVKGGDTGGNGIAYKAQLRDKVEVYLDEATLTKPLRWRDPRTIFLCSMTDIFGDWVEDAWLDRIFAVAALCPQHTFIVLTKRPKRMRAYLEEATRAWFGEDANAWRDRWSAAAAQVTGSPCAAGAIEALAWPLPNVWLGVSCGDQDAADAFVFDLIETPAAVRFLSCEPLRGPIDLTRIRLPLAVGIYTHFNALAAVGKHGLDGRLLNWVISGGESGPNARPTHPDWAQGLRDQCAASGVAFFWKQWGEWAPGENADKAQTRTERTADWNGKGWDFSTLTAAQSAETHRDDEPLLFRLGKKAAGHTLDGVEHHAFPQVERNTP